ncbi:MAG: hypothetical protein LUH10_09615 [Tannerellaceae bacterium]|nr:hypothetical protein [Tannerellaceae bacterium]
MKKEFKLMLDFGGIVVFSPHILNQFVQERNIQNKNLLEHFVNVEKDGDDAISSGVVAAIYQIPEQDYHIILTDNEQEKAIPTDWALWQYDFPLEVDTRIVVAGIYAILDWDFTDWTEDKQNYSDAGTANGIHLESGKYRLRITGFNENMHTPRSRFGYLLQFTKAKDFSFFTINGKSVDDFSFSVLPDEN